MNILIDSMKGGLWVAATEKGRLLGLEIDPPQEEIRWGAIYRGKVARIDKAMDAAFIDLGGGQEGLLHNADLRTEKEGHIVKGGHEAIGKTLQPGQMMIIQAKSGYARREDDFDFMRENKRAKLSMDITFPGRFLIYAPMSTENQVSSRIRDKALRDQLMAMMRGFEPIRGLILRASSEDTQSDILLREGKILHKNWLDLQSQAKGDAPALLMEGPDAFARTIGDQAAANIERIEVATMDHFRFAEDWCGIFGPDLMPKIEAVDIEDAQDDLALFDSRGIIGDIEDLFQSYGLLRGGGSIIIEPTAALTAIDVNRGADDRPSFDVNAEAAAEVARQIRLRNIGGIILIDFLKMQKKAEQARFMALAEELFGADPCTVQIHGLTALGLLEITRRRRTPPLSERLDMVDSF
jgi:Rne/Rng family ribonuclease